MSRVNSSQSWVIFNTNTGRIIGTDSRTPFTEQAAHQKCAILQEYTEDELRVEQIAPLFVALAPSK